MASSTMLPFSPGYDFVAARRMTINGRPYEPGQVLDQGAKDALGPRRLRTLYEGRKVTPSAPTYPKLPEPPEQPAVTMIAADLGLQAEGLLQPLALPPDSAPPEGREAPAGDTAGEGAGEGAEASCQPDTGGEGERQKEGQEGPQEQTAGTAGQDSAEKGTKSPEKAVAGSDKPASYSTLEDAVADLRKTDLSGFVRPLMMVHKGFGRWYVQDAAGSLVLPGHMAKAIATRFGEEHLAAA